MNNTRPQLTEKISILTTNTCDIKDTLLYEKYKECYKTRAKVQQIWFSPNNEKIYYVAFQLPPAVLRNTPFTGISWHGNEYVFTSPLKIAKNKLMYGTVKLIT